MKINMVKNYGGTLCPASDIEEEQMKRFKSGDMYEIDIKLTRNGQFHRKVFAFFNFCFKYWASDNEYECEARQFDVFRAHMTVLAGYYDTYYALDGKTRIEAKSLCFAKMEQKEFEKLYTALINVALRKIFKNADDITYNTLVEFF